MANIAVKIVIDGMGCVGCVRWWMGVVVANIAVKIVISKVVTVMEDSSSRQ